MDSPGWIRVSDTEREAVIARLNAATAEGRLGLDEFGDRARSVYAARTRDELAALLADLPNSPAAQSSAPAVWALTLGVLSVLMVPCAPVGMLTGFAGAVLGVAGLRRARRGLARFPGVALAGLICATLGVVAGTVMFVIVGSSITIE